jgi:hypothetical protein
MRSVFFIFFISLLSSSVHAQQSLGHAASSYSGLHGAAVNPSQLSFNQRSWGIHLPGVGANLQNNSLVVDRINLLATAFGRTYSFEVDNARNRSANAQAEIFLRANFDNPLDLRLQTWVMGLGGFFQYGRHAFGLSAGGRAFLELSIWLQLWLLSCMKVYDLIVYWINKSVHLVCALICWGLPKPISRGLIAIYKGVRAEPLWG